MAWKEVPRETSAERPDQWTRLIIFEGEDPEWVKVERVGVLRECRGEGLGTQLMDLVEATARNNGKRITLNAQTGVVDWYANRGYEPVGEPFEEAGIVHRRMTKQP